MPVVVMEKQMSFGEMEMFTERFNDIFDCQDKHVKERRLTNLMSDLEMQYRIA